MSVDGKPGGAAGAPAARASGPGTPGGKPGGAAVGAAAAAAAADAAPKRVQRPGPSQLVGGQSSITLTRSNTNNRNLTGVEEREAGNLR